MSQNSAGEYQIPTGEHNPINQESLILFELNDIYQEQKLAKNNPNKSQPEKVEISPSQKLFIIGDDIN